MKLTQTQRCLLWLSAAEVTPAKVEQLLVKYGSYEDIWEGFGKSLTKTTSGEGVILSRLYTPGAMEDMIGRLDSLDIQVMFRGDDAYPDPLASLDDSPYVLYGMGDFRALTLPMVGVVGTRLPSSYGRDMARNIGHDLAATGVCVVSGMARGIDSAAHEGALKAQGITVAVLGSGLNVPYPAENASLLKRIAESGGLAISEFPLDAEPKAFHFPRRNRIISGLCSGLVFVEGKVQSGGMSTVTHALAQGREVFGVPGRAGTTVAEGPHTIIREGARLVTCGQDILEDLGLIALRQVKHYGAQQETVIPMDEAIMQPPTIAEALGREPMTLDQLSSATKRDPQELLTELSVMEILGHIRKEAGNFFVLTI